MTDLRASNQLHPARLSAARSGSLHRIPGGSGQKKRSPGQSFAGARVVRYGDGRYEAVMRLADESISLRPFHKIVNQHGNHFSGSAALGHARALAPNASLPSALRPLSARGIVAKTGESKQGHRDLALTRGARLKPHQRSNMLWHPPRLKGLYDGRSVLRCLGAFAQHQLSERPRVIGVVARDRLNVDQ
jgi:hypothetical protein